MFASALAHGDTEAAVIQRLGPAKAFAQSVSDRPAMGKRQQVVWILGILLFGLCALVALGIFIWIQLQGSPAGVIGQADAMTTIQVRGGRFSLPALLLPLGALALVGAVLLIWQYRRRK